MSNEPQMRLLINGNSVGIMEIPESNSLYIILEGQIYAGDQRTRIKISDVAADALGDILWKRMVDKIKRKGDEQQKDADRYEEIAGLREAMCLLSTCYEAIRADEQSKNWIAPAVWKSIVEATDRVRAELSKNPPEANP